MLLLCFTLCWIIPIGICNKFLWKLHALNVLRSGVCLQEAPRPWTKLSNLKIYCLTKDKIVQEIVERSKNFFLRQTDDGLKLKENHTYYYQSQGVMNILGLDWIDFVVYTNLDILVQKSHRDISLWEHKMLPELTSFYISYILPLSNN